MAGPKILVVDDNGELLALLSAMLEEAGYTPMAFTRGKPAIERARIERPALALLDVLLPDIMGYEVAAVCRKELSVPVIFLTGVFKGGHHALAAKARYDALGWFEKPFEAAALLDAIRKVVEPARPPPVTVAPGPEPGDIPVDDEATGESARIELTGRVALQKPRGASETIEGAALTAQPSRRPPRRAPPPPPPEALVVSPPGRSGALSDNLPSLVTAFYQAKETGELLLARRRARKIIFFERGQPVFALSNVAADRFGQFLARVGRLRDDQLVSVLDKARETGRRTGDVLIEMGLLEETEKLYYLGQQVKAIIYSLFAWEEGSFQMTFRDRATPRAIKLDLPPATLILRAVRKLYRPERLHRIVQPGDRLRPAQGPPYQLTQITLEPWEAQLLASLDGKKTAGAIVAAAGRPENALYATLVALLSLGFVEKG